MKQYYNEVIEELLHTEANKATKYISPKEIVRGVRKSYRFNGRKHIKGANVEITLTIGKPNYIEREFIKACQKAGEPFPVKKIQVKFPTFSKPSLASRSKMVKICPHGNHGYSDLINGCSKCYPKKVKNVLTNISQKELQNLKLKEGHAVEFIKE